MKKKEIKMAMFEAVLDAEEETGGQIWFETVPHCDIIRVHTIDTKRYPDDAEYEIVDLLYAEPTEEALDALRWRLLPENLRKVWTKA